MKIKPPTKSVGLKKNHKFLWNLAAFQNSPKWSVNDVNTLQPTETYDLRHDRAAFHFLTTQEQIEKYRSMDL
ncbi:MAG: hypothetical protein WA749_00440 [Gelidibacter sp.]